LEVVVAPDQPANAHPWAGVAVNAMVEPNARYPEQADVQSSMPPGVDETLPLPTTLTAAGCPLVKLALRLVFDWIVKVQVGVPVPLQGPPLHWKKAPVPDGISVTVTTVPLVKHLFEPHVNGVGLTPTDPEPVAIALIETLPTNCAVIVAGAEVLGEHVVAVSLHPPPLQPPNVLGEIAFSPTLGLPSGA
jgi:hypothetical protein